jgi:phosphotransferase system, enzyme I, PtsP
VLDAAGDKPVTFRTLDIGGDKVLPYMRKIEEETRRSAGARSGSASTGPACCAPSCARCCAPPRPRAAHHVPDDRRRSPNSISPRRAVERELDLRICAGTATNAADSSSSAPWSRCRRCCGSSTRSLERADFLSVGSNDLCNTSTPPTAAIRASPAASTICRRRCLRALKASPTPARAHRKPVTLCGEMGGRPIGALALIAIGYRSLSMSPTGDRPGQGDAARPRSRRRRRSRRSMAARRGRHGSMREPCSALAAANGVPLVASAPIFRACRGRQPSSLSHEPCRMFAK